jgi:hypothetical protein
MDVIHSMRAALLLMVIAISSIVSACYPRPHEFTSTPEISGVLFNGGVPVTEARVVIAHTRGDDGNYCRDGRVVGVTDKDGRFHVDPGIDIHLFKSLLNPPNTVFQMTSVCFELPGQQKFGALIMALTDRKTSFEMSCDLNSVPREFKQGVVWSVDKWGICSNPE